MILEVLPNYCFITGLSTEFLKFSENSQIVPIFVIFGESLETVPKFGKWFPNQVRSYSSL
jgi:hypothetical protein